MLVFGSKNGPMTVFYRQKRVIGEFGAVALNIGFLPKKSLTTIQNRSFFVLNKFYTCLPYFLCHGVLRKC
jgi:hypothetical protein